MKKKGFTLIELLAVIVILAVIALITTPLIMGIIEDAKKNAFRDSAYGIIKAVQNDSMRIGIQTGGFAVGKYDLAEGELNYKGSLPKQGKAAINIEGKVAIEMNNGTWCAYKELEQEEVKLKKVTKEEPCDGSTIDEIDVEEGLPIDERTFKIYYEGEADFSDYPKRIAGETTLTIEFKDPIPSKVSIEGSETFQYENGILTVPNVTSDLTIHVMFNELLIDYLTSLVEPGDTRQVITLDSPDNTCTNTFAFDFTNDNNLRYVGQNPCNYVYFNCDENEEPSSSTCELWRIIGVMNHVKGEDSAVKIVREESIGNYSWDSSRSDEVDPDTTNKTHQGHNKWSEADIMKTMNEGFDSNKVINYKGEEKTANNSLYWNRSSGLCANGNANDVRDCDFTSTGLKSNMDDYIESVTWKLGGTKYNVYSADNYTAKKLYEAERGTSVFSTREKEWSGKVALIYPSDYVYATTAEECLTSTPNKWSSTLHPTCLDNYLNHGTNMWTLQPLNANQHYVLYMNSNGQIADSNASNAFAVYPSLYLKTTIKVAGGVGSRTNPYIIEK